MLSFPFDLYLGGFLVSLGFALVAVPIWKKLCTSFNLIDDPGHRKIHSVPTPLAGGPGVFSAMVATLFLGAGVFLIFPSVVRSDSTLVAGSALLHGINRRTPQLLVLLMGSCGMLLLGLFDDRFELPARWKFLGQLLIAGLTAGAGLRITLFVPNLFFSYAITILWVLTVTNALNFLDNMNGLCTGIGIIVAWACAWLAAVHGQYLVAFIAFTAAGSLLGFLPYNFPKASAFLGDAGSHLVGYWCAVLTILPNYYPTTGTRLEKWVVLIPLLLLAVPLLDLVYVVALRWRIGQPVYLGDTNHISHRLVRRGYSRSHAVLLILLTTAIACFLAVWAVA